MRKLFGKITLTQLYCLCKTIGDSEVRQKNYIRQKYRNTAMWFDETLIFACEIKVIKEISEELIPLKSLFPYLKSLEEFKPFILQKLFSVHGEVSNCLKQFLINFQLRADEYVFNATPTDKIKFSDVRNFLLELDFISVNRDSDSYVVNSNCNELFTQLLSLGEISAETFKISQKEKDKLGLAAENEIIEFEKKRLTKIIFGLDEIEHTSQKNVFAGYDIKSFENYLDQNSNRIIRCIEVKAVSIYDYKFYWSKNEIDVANVQRAHYYLYLLPVKSNGVFNMENLKIIPDPYVNVFENRIDWEIENESYSFLVSH
jgi:hypothetical protein